MEQDPALAAVRTYGYLRLALAGLVLLLFAAVAIEYLATGRSCLQTSISAYWHTPVRAVFVGVLVTMGVCLVALKGNTPGEDIALNFAGMLAPGVAFIPTGDPGTCSSVPIQVSDVAPAVRNNMQALLVLGVVALVIGVAFALGQLKTTYATSNRLEAASGLPVIGSIGEVVTAGEAALRKQRLRYLLAGVGGLGVAYVALLGVEFLQRGLAA